MENTPHIREGKTGSDKVVSRRTLSRDAMVASGRVLEADVALLRSEVARMIRSLNSTEVERVRRPRKK